MKLVARTVDWAQCPGEIAATVPPGQLFLTTGKEYEAHALSVTNGIVYVQIVDESGWPNWTPVWFFDLVDPAIPHDWISRVDHGRVQLVLGPEFVARDAETLSSMASMDADQVARFWKRVNALAPKTSEAGEG